MVVAAQGGAGEMLNKGGMRMDNKLELSGAGEYLLEHHLVVAAQEVPGEKINEGGTRTDTSWILWEPETCSLTLKRPGGG